MKSIYVSHGSEFADLESIDSFCSFNPPSDLTVVLFSDMSNARRSLLRCYPGITVVKSPSKCSQSVGIFDSACCDRDYALKKVQTFTRELVALMQQCVHKDSGSKVFVFNETVKVTSKTLSWNTPGPGENYSVSYSSSTEMKHPDNKVSRFPSLLSGSLVHIPRDYLSEIASNIKHAARELPCMRSCSCLVDLIFHRATTHSAIHYMDDKVTVNACSASKSERLAEQSRRHTQFVDVSEVFDSSRIITSPYRYIPDSNQHICRHAIRDSCCKVAIVTSGMDHAALLTSLVTKLAHKASSLDRFLGITNYKVYLLDGLRGHHSKIHNSVKVNVSNLRRIAQRCKHVCFFAADVIPTLEFFLSPTWMKTEYAFKSLDPADSCQR